MERCFRKTQSTIQRSFSHTHMWGWALSTNQRWSRLTPLLDFLASEKPDQQINAHFCTHICGGIGLNGLCQQINGGPVRHPSQIFWPQKNPINNSMLIFTHTCWGIGLNGLCQQINAGPVRHPSRIFLLQKTPINN